MFYDIPNWDAYNSRENSKGGIFVYLIQFSAFVSNSEIVLNRTVGFHAVPATLNTMGNIIMNYILQSNFLLKLHIRKMVLSSHNPSMDSCCHSVPCVCLSLCCLKM
jgi:hypothetical protein